MKNLLDNHRNYQIYREYSGVEIYHLPELSAYLKSGDIGKNSNLRWERRVLTWLSGKIDVPAVIEFELTGNVESLLISELLGQPYSDNFAVSENKIEIESLVETVAKQIRVLHDLPIHDCPLDQRLDTKLKKAEENLRGGFVVESDFDIENRGKTGRQVFDELLTHRPSDEDLVFTHGDLCLPNIIICGRAVSGFIDFDRGGVADRYQDLALFLRSFRFNSRTAIDITSAFLNGYGVDTLDHDKLNFYRKLDELF